jgi:hypothetical protein
MKTQVSGNKISLAAEPIELEIKASREARGGLLEELDKAKSIEDLKKMMKKIVHAVLEM